MFSLTYDDDNNNLVDVEFTMIQGCIIITTPRFGLVPDDLPFIMPLCLPLGMKERFTAKSPGKQIAVRPVPMKVAR